MTNLRVTLAKIPVEHSCAPCLEHIFLNLRSRMRNHDRDGKRNLGRRMRMQKLRMRSSMKTANTINFEITIHYSTRFFSFTFISSH